MVGGAKGTGVDEGDFGTEQTGDAVKLSSFFFVPLQPDPAKYVITVVGHNSLFVRLDTSLLVSRPPSTSNPMHSYAKRHLQQLQALLREQEGEPARLPVDRRQGPREDPGVRERLVPGHPFLFSRRQIGDCAHVAERSMRVKTIRHLTLSLIRRHLPRTPPLFRRSRRETLDRIAGDRA